MDYELSSGAGTVVVIPSISFPSVELRKITGIEHYEERMLFSVLALEDPSARVVYATSVPVPSAVVDYYLGFLESSEYARGRLHLVSADDPEPRALSAKLLDRPPLLAALRSALGDELQGYVLPFNVTPLEARIASSLGLPLYGPRPELVALGSKSGARRLARGGGVPVVDGAEELSSLAEIRRAVQALRARRPDVRAVVIKLNNGFSGQGNAILETATLGDPLEVSPVVFCAASESWASYAAKVAAEGAVVEELVRAPGVVSPSVQLRIRPDGTSELVSSHDQILGGPDDQVYLGCRFPSRSSYRRAIAERGLRIAELLADRGVIGSFGVDFLVVPGPSGERIYLSEINLRMGGTTHPFAMARVATGGRYDAASGDLVAAGRAKSYVATDNLKSDAYLGLSPGDVIGAVASAGLAFDRRTGRGVTLHLLGAVPRYGKLGAVCIGDSAVEADALYERLVAVLETAAIAAGSSGRAARSARRSASPDSASRTTR
jgi:hypothetical protein